MVSARVLFQQKGDFMTNRSTSLAPERKPPEASSVRIIDPTGKIFPTIKKEEEVSTPPKPPERFTVPKFNLNFSFKKRSDDEKDGEEEKKSKEEDLTLRNAFLQEAGVEILAAVSSLREIDALLPEEKISTAAKRGWEEATRFLDKEYLNRPDAKERVLCLALYATH